jgi:hypothetical protein
VRLIRRPRLGGLALSSKNVAAAIRETTSEAGTRRPIELLQRLIVGLFVKQQGGQTQARELAQFILAVFHHPGQLQLGGLDIAGINIALAAVRAARGA